MFFLCPETAYQRHRVYDIDQIQDQDFEKLAARRQQESPLQPGAEPKSKKTYWQSLKPWSGTHSNANVIHLAVTPFFVLLNIGASYTIFAIPILTASMVSVSLTLAQIFSPPPYGFTAAKVGYLSTGPFIGGLLACGLMAVITDPMIRYCSRKNRGI